MSSTVTAPQKQTYEINGQDFSTLEEFFERISQVLIPGESWGRNLDAFNDILGGGFGTPYEGFKFVWRNAKLSKQRLGYEETARVLQRRIRTCHPSNVEKVTKQLRKAENSVGNTIYDELVDIIREHRDADRGGVELELD